MKGVILAAFFGLSAAATGCAAPSADDGAEVAEGAIQGTPSEAKRREVQDAYRAASASDFVEVAKPTSGPIAKAIADAEARDCAEWEFVAGAGWVERASHCYEWTLWQWRAGSTKYLVVELTAATKKEPVRRHDYRTPWNSGATIGEVWVYTAAPEPSRVTTGRLVGGEVHWAQ